MKTIKTKKFNVYIKNGKVVFTKHNIKNYLDLAINQLEQDDDKISNYYVDAFKIIRSSLYEE